MGTCGDKTVQLRMGLKILASNEHSAEAAILPSAAWHLVWALGTMKKETGEVLVDGLCGGGAKSLNFTEMKIGYTGEGDMTILPEEAYCNLQVDLTGEQTAEYACARIRAHLDAHGCADVSVEPA